MNSSCVKPIATIFQEADVLLIVGANPRFEAPLINARIRKRLVDNHFCVHFFAMRAYSEYSAHGGHHGFKYSMLRENVSKN